MSTELYRASGLLLQWVPQRLYPSTLHHGQGRVEAGLLHRAHDEGSQHKLLTTVVAKVVVMAMRSPHQPQWLGQPEPQCRYLRTLVRRHVPSTKH